MTRKTTLFLTLALILLPALLVRAQPPGQFLVTLAAPSAQARTNLLDRGLDLWGADMEGVTFLVDAAELKALQSQGYEIAALTPLDFPPNFDDYHDYDETVVEINAVAAAFPAITRVQSIGQSLEGREIWAVRITDNPDQDEPGEKGILIFANMHAREHLTTEQTLFLIHDLTENYGVQGEITNLVDQRDIWIIPTLNPDGKTYDIDQWRVNSPRWWRKNRRDNGDGTWGVDLNRNFGYEWGRDNDGSSGNTYSELYRGSAPFSEPESQALRDFAAAHPNLTASLSLHTYGELILYPYGYTYDDAPPDMAPADLPIFRALAQGMADRNGYRPQQASDLYLVNGISEDWLYGDLGLYAFTWELYPRSGNPGFYPDESVIAAQTARNRSALRYSISMADDPAKSVGDGSDMTPPQIQVLSPQTGDTLYAYAPISVTVAVTDDVGVTTVEYLLDDEVVAVRTAPDLAARLVLPEGDYMLSARAFDAAHWQSLSAPRLLRLVPDPNATPTATPTATATPACTELAHNGGFEENGAWTFTATATTAGYSGAQAYGGARSARFGLLPAAGIQNRVERERDVFGAVIPAEASFSSGYQTLALPVDSDEVMLRFWFYPASDDDSGDFQRLLLLDTENHVVANLMQVLKNNRSWTQASFDLSAYGGQTLRIYFEVYNDDIGNDGRAGRTWMYVDDVSVQACNRGTPLPTATVTPTPGLTPTSTPTLTPAAGPSSTPTPTPSPTATPDLDQPLFLPVILTRP